MIYQLVVHVVQGLSVRVRRLLPKFTYVMAVICACPLL